jgi:hypothetical protein
MPMNATAGGAMLAGVAEAERIGTGSGLPA